MNQIAVELAAAERFPFGLRPPEGGMVAITEDVFWLHLTAVRAPLGGVNVWAIRNGDGWTIVDTGFAGAATQQEWQGLLARHLPGPIRQIICTHFHPDHVGQVGFLQSLDHAPLFMTAVEWHAAKRNSLGQAEDALAAHLAYLRLCGLPPDYEPALVARISETNAIVLPESCELLEAGDTITIGRTQWEIQIGAGHSPAPALLFNRRDGLVIVGDQLLMRITPHIGGMSDDLDDDTLGAYLRFLDGAQSMDPALRALPGHGAVFVDAGARAAAIAAHHQDRLAALLPVLGEPMRCLDVIEPLFGRKLEGAQLSLGLTEAHAHLNHLTHIGAVERSTDDAGCYRFQRIG